MRNVETRIEHRRHRAGGFSLLEMTMVVALSIVVTVVSVVSLMPLLQSQHLTNAYNTTMSLMRQARDNAISQRTSYSLTFVATTSGNTITMVPTTAFGESVTPTIYKLPTDVWFLVGSGANTVPAPDSFGAATQAIDFGYTSNGNAGGTTSSVIYFCPDGSAQTSASCAGAGTWDGGVVYINGPVVYVSGSPTGYASNSRAISLWGATGRLHGWRLYPKGANYQWLRQ